MRADDAGVLPDTEIECLMDAGRILGVADRGQVQPASVDLTLGPVAHRVRAGFLPGPGTRVRDGVDALTFGTLDLSAGAVLEPGAVYLVEARESLSLGSGMSGRANPKSSTGRIDLFVRALGDGASRYDDLGAGYRGPVWLEVAPHTFPVVVREGSRLAQLRLRTGQCGLDADGMREAGLAGVDAAGMPFSVDLSPRGSGPAGWRARRHAGAVDVDAVGTLRVADFWEPVATRQGPSGRHGLVLDPGEFYILASRESIRVPAHLAAEMVPFDAGYGELRAHYAGFFDPGFGCGSEARAVLEVRSHQVPFMLEDGQAVGKLVFERMLGPPARPYGEGTSSNYVGQGLKLSKHFS